jgi:nucleotide-binding universal stress UspA family protein
MALERANRTVEHGIELARNAGFNVDGRRERSMSAAWRTILDVADEADAQLIVAGARGLSSLQSLLLGSTSTALVHHATRPILVVPLPPEAVQEQDKKD